MMIAWLPKTRVNVLGLMALAAMAVQAQGPKIAGFVELGFNRNLTIHSDSNKVNAFHSYDFKANTFSLNNAHLAISGADSATGLGYAVETDFGTDAIADNVYDFPGSASVVSLQEAYLTYAFGPGWGLKAGKYVTTEGIEVIEGGANPTVTRGYLFGLAECLTHTGLELSYAAGIFDVHLGVINGWDVVLDNNSMPSYMAKAGINLGDPLVLAVSSIIGPEKNANTDDMRMSFDATGVTKVIPMVDLWFQGNYGLEDKASAVKAGDDASWMGFGLQPLVHLSDKFAVGFRYEFFSDPDGARTGSTVKDLSLQNISVAPTAWLTPNLMARTEFRVDFASEDVFMDEDDKATGSQMIIAADAIASF